MSGTCTDRVVIVTGAGRGLGREHALELAREGAAVVVNDLGSERDGSGSSDGPAGEVVDTIRAAGGRAVANGEDVANWEGAGRLVRCAIDEFGDLDGLVNNAGVLRDRLAVNMGIDEWDTVMRVHLRGTFAPTRHAFEYWRARSKDGDTRTRTVVSTSSGAGLYGNVGQANYAAAKAGIAAFTQTTAREVLRYGVSVNAIAPEALTRMTEDLPQVADEVAAVREDPDAFHFRDARNVSPLVAWLSSVEAAPVTGQVFQVVGGQISVVDGWRRGPDADKGARWEAAELGGVVTDLVAKAQHPFMVDGRTPLPVD